MIVEERAGLINAFLIFASPGIVVVVGGVLIWIDMHLQGL